MRKRMLLLLVLAVLLVATACAPDTSVASEPQRPTDQSTQPTTPPPDIHTHSYSGETTAPTCTGRGFTRYTCPCGDTYSVYTEATGHRWDDGTLLEAASETRYERRSYTCRVCQQQQENFLVNGQPYTPRPGNSDYGFRYLGTLENGLELQNMYLRMYEACEAFMQNQQDITEETKNQLLITKNEMSYKEFSDVFWSAFWMFCWENPRYYWLKEERTEVFRPQYGYNLDIDEDYYLASVRRECDAAIEEMERSCAAILTDRMTQAEKAQLIHDHIRWKMDYAYDPVTHKPEESVWAHSMIGCAVKGQGVCEAYAKTFQYLCLRNDVPCLFVFGVYGASNHAWNYFQAEGVWYGTDVTFDDSNPLHYDFFGCSEAGITYDRKPAEAGNTWYELPELSKEKLELSTIHILPFLTEIPDHFYYHSENMTQVDIPDTVTHIGRYAFAYCQNLRCVNIPASVTEIGRRAFCDNEALTDIYYGGTKQQWVAINFETNWDLGTDAYTVHCTDGDIPPEHPTVAPLLSSASHDFILPLPVNKKFTIFRLTIVNRCDTIGLQK